MLLFSDKTKSIAFLIGIAFLFVGLTFSKAITSLVTVYFILFYIVQNEDKQSLAFLLKNISLRYFILLVGWMTLSLLWSKNKTNGIQLFGSNLNFFIWPILMVLFSDKINRYYRKILLLFTFIVTLVSLIHFTNFQFLDGYHDIREMALHVSHIRFSLMIVIALFISIYFLMNELKTSLRVLWFFVISWLLFYTYYSQVLSGVLAILGGLFGIISYIIFKNSHRGVKGIAITMVFLLSILFTWLVYDISSPEVFVLPKKLDTHTKLGNRYENNIHSKIIENGHFLDLYYCEKEVDSSWKLRSDVSLEDLSPRGYRYKYVLKRYLTSKGLRKDSFGVKTLSSQDIINIESGIPSVVELEKGFLTRYKQLKYELSGNLDPNGHSILQRFEFWKASKMIIIENWFLGVGLGSSKDAFLKKYKKMNSKLLIENQWESHNQFLSIWISFGIVGLLLFILWLTSIFKNTLKNNWLQVTIFGVLIFSFFVEDTLSTLVGMTLFAFFAGIFQNNLSLKKD